MDGIGESYKPTSPFLGLLEVGKMHLIASLLLSVRNREKLAGCGDTLMNILVNLYKMLRIYLQIWRLKLKRAFFLWDWLVNGLGFPNKQEAVF
jgi:hypothetical protein